MENPTRFNDLQKKYLSSNREGKSQSALTHNSFFSFSIRNIKISGNLLYKSAESSTIFLNVAVLPGDVKDYLAEVIKRLATSVSEKKKNIPKTLA